MNQNNTEIIVGFDLGHGETSVAYTSVTMQPQAACSFEQPQSLLLVGSDMSSVTVLAVEQSGRVVIGDEALAAVNPVRVTLDIKSLDHARHETLALYVRTCVERLIEKKIPGIEHGKVQFIVGCPSGWSAKALPGEISERETYRRGLTEAVRSAFQAAPVQDPDCNCKKWSQFRDPEKCPVRVVPESRAALLELKDSQYFDPEELKSSVVVIDIGSSTTDISVVAGLQEIPEDFGHNSLGGYLIDEQLYRQLKQPETLDPLTDEHRAQNMIAIRNAKHRYFLREETYDEAKERAACDPDEFFLDHAMIASALNAPLEGLSGKSWHDTFTDLMMNTKARLAAQKIVPAAVAITGGASRMPFVQELVRAAFPDAKIRLDQQPELTVARGLARIGRWDIYGNRFLEEINGVIASTSFRAAVRSALTATDFKPGGVSFLRDVSNRFATVICEKAVGPKLQNWRKGKIETLRHLQSKTSKAARGLEELSDIWTESNTLLYRKALAGIIAEKITPVCVKYGIPVSEIQLPKETPTASVDLPDNISKMLYDTATTIGLIVFVNLFGGAGTAVVPGAGGLLLGAVLAVLIQKGMAHQANDYILDMNIPLSLRQLVILDNDNPIAKLGDLGSDGLAWFNKTFGANLPNTIALRSCERIVTDMLEDVKKATFESMEQSSDTLADNIVVSSSDWIRDQARLALVHMT